MYVGSLDMYTAIGDEEFWSLRWLAWLKLRVRAQATNSGARS